MGDSKFSGAVALKKAGMPGLAVVAFLVATAGDVHDIFFDNTEQLAKAEAERAEKKAWEAAWEAFEAREKLKLLAEQSRMRIQFLEQRTDSAERNVENLRVTIRQMLMQDRDNRNVPTPVVVRKPSVPKALKPSAPAEDWIEEACEGSDPLCGMEGSAEEPTQQIAPMPSLDDMWREQSASKKAQFKEKFSGK